MHADTGRPQPLDLRYDIDRDRVTIDGVVYSGAFFRAFDVPPGERRALVLYRDARGHVQAERLHAIDGSVRPDVDDLDPAPAESPLTRAAAALRARRPTIDDVEFVFSAIDDPTPQPTAAAQLATETVRAHLLVDGEPVCLHRAEVGLILGGGFGQTVACEYATFDLGIAAMGRLHERHPDRTFEAVSGPCPVCHSKR